MRESAATPLLRREWLGKTTLLLVGCLLAVVVGEVLLRLTGLGSPSPLVPYESLPFKRRPSHEFLNRREIVQWVELNSWGFHDRERRATSSSYRFLALGDSFVEGLQVAVGDLFTTRIEEDLNRRGRDVEVLNAGVGGVGTAYQYLLYEEFFADRIEIDHVLLFVFNGNDLGNNHPVLERKVLGNEPSGKVYLDHSGEVWVRPHERSWRQRALAFTDRHSALSYTVHTGLYQLKRALRERRRPPHEVEPASTSGASSQEHEIERLAKEWKASLEGTLALVERWHHKLEAQGVEFSVVVLPDASHFSDPPYGHPVRARFASELERLAERANFPLLALHFEGREPGDVFTYDGERYGHFTPVGHRIAAKAIAAWLLDQPATAPR